MKNIKEHIGKHVLIFALLLGSAISYGFINKSKISPPTKVTICHVPPGNPSNCHEITISINALQKHLNHGDRLICNSPEEEARVIEAVDAGNIYVPNPIIRNY